MIWEADVLVVGLGPAGGSAAAAASRQGLSVIGVDRRKVVGVPVQCAEFVPALLEGVARLPGVTVQTVDGMCSVLPSGETSHMHAPGRIIRRDAFDQALAAAARAAGAEIWLNANFVRLDQSRRRAWIEVDGLEREVAYRVLIGADGPHSRVAQSLGMDKQSIVFGRQYTVPLVSPLRETRVWLHDDYPGGYAWLFPKDDRANLGVALDKGEGADIKAVLERRHQSLVDQGVLGSRVLSMTGGAIPVGGLRRELVRDNVVLVGDAGGFVHPVTGAGIQPAIVSGERAGLAAVEWLRGEGGALNGFEQDMRELFQQPWNRALAARRWLREGGRKLDDRDRVHRVGWTGFKDYFVRWGSKF